GDVVGYGPEPEACIDLIKKRCKVFLMGNHDYAMLNVPIGFNPIAEQAIWCLKSRMEPGIYSMPRKRERWKFLGKLQHTYLDEEILCVHASPRDPILEYIVSTDPLHNPEKMESIFARVEHLAFCGHTHVPGVFTESPDFISPEEMEGSFEVTKEKAIINIGSVGQPRDGNAKACYALYDGRAVEWRRVEYDIDQTVQKIKEVECLHPRNGERLYMGL
ncbi:MAG: metallophosphoesterase family protein, partial [Planctomycetes bacterium]|nr:metallophosphoesterase family protein [Planctomycetota bacterium]